MAINLHALQPGPRTGSFYINLAMTLGIMIFLLVMCVLVLTAEDGDQNLGKYSAAGFLAGIVLVALAIRGGFNQVAFHMGGSN